MAASKHAPSVPVSSTSQGYWIVGGHALKDGGEAEEAIRIPIDQIRATLGIVEPNTVAVGPRGGHEAGQHGQQSSGTKHGVSACQDDLVEANDFASGSALEDNTYDDMRHTSFKIRGTWWTYMRQHLAPGCQNQPSAWRVERRGE